MQRGPVHMLQLKNIVKNYSAGDSTVAALRGVSVSFRDREFVAVLGPSGCGKTTLLAASTSIRPVTC